MSSQISNEEIAETVAEAARVTIQAMAAARAERIQNVRPRLGRSIKETTIFNWEAEDKCNELKTFRLEVNNIFKSYSMLQAEKIAIIKK